MAPTVIERLAAKVSVNADTGCWEWQGVLMPNGYGRMRMAGMGGKEWLAHRLSWEALRGPIPEGLTIDHLCRVRHCVNPDHLEPVTHRENVRRGTAGAGGRDRQLAKTHCPSGHAYEGDNVYVNPTTRKRTCRACSNASHNRRRNPAKWAA